MAKITGYIRSSNLDDSCWPKEAQRPWFSVVAILAIALYSYCASAATIYKCSGKDGGIVFSQQPCGLILEQIEIETHQSPSEEIREEKEKSTHEDYNKGLRARLAIKKWERKKKSLQNRIKALEQERDKLIEELNEELDESWDHQANHTRMIRIQAIKDDYRRKIIGAQRDLRNHRETNP